MKTYPFLVPTQSVGTHSVGCGFPKFSRGRASVSAFPGGTWERVISCPYKQLRYLALAPVPSPMLGRGVPRGRGEGSYNKSLTGHDITSTLVK